MSPRYEGKPIELWHGGQHTSTELADLFDVARSTVYRAVQRAGKPTTTRPHH